MSDPLKPYSNLVAFYFSGTGNAKQIAQWFCDAAKSRGLPSQMINIAKSPLVDPSVINANTLLLIISPIHGFNFPKITLNFLQQFPKGSQSIVLINTRAGMKLGNWVTPGLTGVAFFLASFILSKKGYTIKGQIPFDMPSNWISIHPALNENTVRFLYQKNLERVQKHAEFILNGKPDFASHRDLIQDILIAPVSLGYYLAGRFLFAKSFYASPDCDNCGLCIKQCPVQAIESIQNRPFWKFNCESCMKCLNQCPQNAIETAHGLALITSLISALLTTYFVSPFLGLNDYPLINFSLLSVVFFAVLWALYRIQHRLLQIPQIGKLIAFTSLTHYKFWGRYNYKTRAKKFLPKNPF
jgi:Pyruvate/2-oxoacid:ferredoxin oxidoreductase delta subunit/flavodoxin